VPTRILSDAGAAFHWRSFSTRESKPLIAQLADMKVFQVNIGAGNLSSGKIFWNCWIVLQEKGIVACVSTNGLLVDDALAHRLAGFKQLYLQVSLDGVTEEVNDRDSRQGDVSKDTVGLGIAFPGRVFPTVSIRFLTRLNYSQLDSLRALASQYGAGLRVSRFRPSGRGRTPRNFSDRPPTSWKPFRTG